MTGSIKPFEQMVSVLRRMAANISKVEDIALSQESK